MHQTPSRASFSPFRPFLYVPLFPSLYRLVMTNKQRERSGQTITKSTHTRLGPKASTCRIYSPFASFPPILSLSLFFLLSHNKQRHMEHDTPRPPPLLLVQAPQRQNSFHFPLCSHQTSSTPSLPKEQETTTHRHTANIKRNGMKTL